MFPVFISVVCLCACVHTSRLFDFTDSFVEFSVHYMPQTRRQTTINKDECGSVILKGRHFPVSSEEKSNASCLNYQLGSHWTLNIVLLYKDCERVL